MKLTSGKPQVAYRETIRGNADQDSKFVRQSGGKGQYGHVKVRISPAEENAGFVFENKIVGGAVPREYIEPARKGMEEALEGGILAGYPMIDVKVELYDGSYHEVDSSEMAFKIAGSMAIKEGTRKAQPCILEPMMKLKSKFLTNSQVQSSVIFQEDVVELKVKNLLVTPVT